eukprot:CAMPEP_0170197966 /NCGR_PEP_ID=MMETSP0040_2-20121228/67646_1 /TAXON_ID=641309 /ORGANISM="Lotharella oceanica, Strain CCMP622" /LENGTH=73 /DNA_ID=CAMNT_0010447787 /DNA_START=150 /DNA_END=371 /DNA_ORIENTATION=-
MWSASALWADTPARGALTHMHTHTQQHPRSAFMAARNHLGINEISSSGNSSARTWTVSPPDPFDLKILRVSST